MGLHTWCDADHEKYKKIQGLYKQIDQLREEIQTDFHDPFRTNKREPDGNYTFDLICSKEECIQWLAANAEFVYEINEEQLNKFWDKYPNGIISFG